MNLILANDKRIGILERLEAPEYIIIRVILPLVEQFVPRRVRTTPCNGVDARQGGPVHRLPRSNRPE